MIDELISLGIDQIRVMSTLFKRWNSVENVVVRSAGETSICVDIKSDEEPGIEAVAIDDASDAGVNIAELDVDELALIWAVFCASALPRAMTELELDACVTLTDTG